MLNHYLAELETELSRRIPAREVQVRMAEIEAHLRDGVECRIEELGLDAEAAIRDTVASFGEVRRIAKAVHRQSLQRLNRVRMLTVGLFMVLFVVGNDAAMLTGRGTPFFAWATLGLWLGSLVSLSALAVVAFRARRPAPGRVTAAGIVTSVALWFVAAIVWLQPADFGGVGTLFRADAPDRIQVSRQNHDWEDADAVERARTDYVGNFVANLRGSVVWAGTLIPVVLAFDLTFGGLGALVGGVRRRPRDRRAGNA